MKLVNAKYGVEFDFQEGKPEIIVIENQRIMREFVGELWSQSVGIEGSFVLSEDKLLKLDKNIEMIVNPFEIDFQSKKIMNALYNKMSFAANEQVEEKNRINTELINILDSISNSINYSGIIYQLDFFWNDLFKMYGVKFDIPEELCLRISEYMKIVSELCNNSIFCIVNIKSYLNQEEIIDLYKSAEYNKLRLLLIESHEYPILDSEHITIIDQDFCVIHKN